MRKQIIDSDQNQPDHSDKNWLDIEHLATVEVTSEEIDFPIESVFATGKSLGWRASDPGKQTIRLLFDHPQSLHHIYMSFEEMEIERTHEYVMRWSAGEGQSCQEIVRQQWNFSPNGATSETEDYEVELPAVTILELSIIPDINDRNAFASLKKLWIA